MASMSQTAAAPPDSIPNLDQDGVSMVTSHSCIYVYYLDGGAITILKNHGVKVNGNDDIPYMKWKIIQMFETTNQLYIYMHNHSEDRIWNILEYYQKNPKDTKLSKFGISLKLQFFSTCLRMIIVLHMRGVS